MFEAVTNVGNCKTGKDTRGFVNSLIQGVLLPSNRNDCHDLPLQRGPLSSLEVTPFPSFLCLVLSLAGIEP